MSRNFSCPETDEPCEDDDCTRSRCEIERRNSQRAAMMALSPEEEEVDRLAKAAAARMAKDYLRTKGCPLTAENIAKVADHPKIRESARQEARREFGELKGLL